MSTERLDHLAAAASMGARTQIDEAAQRAFDRLWSLMLKPGAKSPRDLVLQVAAEFNLDVSEALAQAFSTLLEQMIGPAQVRAMPVGDVVLSQRLYRNSTQVAAEVTEVVRQHAAGVHDARALLLRLYDGYDPQDGIQRPLEGRAIASLPRALREIVAEPGPRADLAALLDDAQRQASRVKSRALRSGYLDLLSTWESGAAREVLRKKLDVAHREKSRFLADRIAQTELARAYQARVAAEVMADTETTVVQVMLNPAHPALDICDLHARADLWGLGKGCYPKARAPRPPYHPFCWCRLRRREDLHGHSAHEVPQGEAKFLRDREQHDPGTAARIMGSAGRATRVLQGESAESVINEGKDRAHWLVRVGDPLAHQINLPIGQPVTTQTPMPTAAQPSQASAHTPESLIEQGRAIFARLPLNPSGHSLWKYRTREWFDALIAELKAAGRLSSTGAKAEGSAEAVKVMREATSLFPQAWNAASDALGVVRVAQASARSRGWHLHVDRQHHFMSPKGFRGTYSVNPGDAFIMLRTGAVANAVHEYAHRLQNALPQLDSIFQQLHRKRVSGDPLEQLGRLHPGHGYLSSEVTRKDGYVSSYQGKEYAVLGGVPQNGGAKEVMTMAFEAVLGSCQRGASDPLLLERMIEKDPEMVHLVLGALFHFP